MAVLNINDRLMALKTSNNFGDQIIVVVDVTKHDSRQSDSDFPYCAGQIVAKFVNIEGNHVPFTVKEMKKLMMRK